MNNTSSFIAVLLIIYFSTNSFCQSFTFHAGVDPTTLTTNFTFKADVVKRGRWLVTGNYTFSKLVTSFDNPNITQPQFHIENKGDITFIDLKELKRGYPLQFKNIDNKPSELHHTFGLLFGYSFLQSRDFHAAIYAGPHLSLSRQILWYNAYDFAKVTVNEREAARTISYHDYQVFRKWDFGGGTRLDLEYYLFENLAIGVSGNYYIDINQGGYILLFGGGITYNFFKK